jgi:hypothetical protein
MFVKDIKGGRSLAHGDEFLSPLQADFALVHAPDFYVSFFPSQPGNSRPTFRTFSGLICGGGGMVGDVLRGISGDYLYRARRHTKRWSGFSTRDRRRASQKCAQQAGSNSRQPKVPIANDAATRRSAKTGGRGGVGGCARARKKPNPPQFGSSSQFGLSDGVT